MEFAEAKSIHDLLLAGASPSVAHDKESCEFCITPDVAVSTPEGRKEGNGMDPIFTQEQADALIEAAVAKALAVAEDEKAKAIADAVSTLTVEVEKLTADVASLQEARDADQIALAAEKERVAALESDIASRDEAVARQARREERLAQVREVASFTETYIEDNADRWTNMSDEQFASTLEDYKDMASQIKPVVETPEATEVPEETAMSNERVDTPKVSARKALFSYTLKGGSN